mmetsp:Transcript_3047/g.6853  ORF Transcript_3047/g.6853 Transcript_3047/m.6853 type:complete len:549 (+) Transcript_3047:295-1941(+)
MYLHSHQLSKSADFNQRERDPKLGSGQNLMSRTVGREMLNGVMARVTMRDTTSSKLQVLGPRQAAAVHKAEVTVLRRELDLFPEGLRELARTNMVMDQNIRQKDLQDVQCSMLGRLEAILRRNIVEAGGDYRKYKVGGYDEGTYERFFRLQPGRYMTKAQLATALRRSFGDSVIKSQAAISQLFDTYDFRRTDQMDWRAFLYMLSLLMQPHLFCDSLLRWGYAIYSSVGSLDLDCEEELSLGMVKAMLCVPVILSLRSEVHANFDRAWQALSSSDTETIQYAARKHTTVTARAGDPEDLKISYRIFSKILTQTTFSKYMATAAVFGPRDQRAWTCRLEEQYYHPRVLRVLKELRREERSSAEAEKFVSRRAYRTKDLVVLRWVRFMRRRNFVRYVLIGGEVRSQISAYSMCFDHWRRVTLEEQSRQLLQCVARGYIARTRRRFIMRIQKKAVKIQSQTRKLFAQQKHRQVVQRIHWGATTIQRMVRGIAARKRVCSIVEAQYDREARLLAKKEARVALLETRHGADRHPDILPQIHQAGARYSGGGAA